jgi:hypothetical protein
VLMKSHDTAALTDRAPSSSCSEVGRHQLVVAPIPSARRDETC